MASVEEKQTRLRASITPEIAFERSSVLYDAMLRKPDGEGCGEWAEWWKLCTGYPSSGAPQTQIGQTQLKLSFGLNMDSSTPLPQSPCPPSDFKLPVCCSSCRRRCHRQDTVPPVVEIQTGASISFPEGLAYTPSSCLASSTSLPGSQPCSSDHSAPSGGSWWKNIVHAGSSLQSEAAEAIHPLLHGFGRSPLGVRLSLQLQSPLGFSLSLQLQSPLEVSRSLQLQGSTADLQDSVAESPAAFPDSSGFCTTSQSFSGSRIASQNFSGSKPPASQPSGKSPTSLTFSAPVLDSTEGSAVPPAFLSVGVQLDTPALVSTGGQPEAAAPVSAGGSSWASSPRSSVFLLLPPLWVVLRCGTPQLLLISHQCHFHLLHPQSKLKVCQLLQFKFASSERGSGVKRLSPKFPRSERGSRMIRLHPEFQSPSMLLSLKSPSVLLSLQSPSMLQSTSILSSLQSLGPQSSLNSNTDLNSLTPTLTR
ncbi:hypothetical protein CRENBAI_010294 [Crenichthys baileyi]|uniref:Uncharacterized protein n=1 Tax=Crenichthys baileyi TaxID=28760 RepID=A0AAV9SE98_9TELE